MLVVVYGVIAAALLTTLVVTIIFKFVVQRAYGVVLVITYVSAMVVVGLIEFKVIPMDLFGNGK